jgi:hypothetical protein
VPGRRHANHRLIKIHRSYTVEEVGRVLTKHKNTVRQWIKDGLPTVPGPRPALIQGLDLRRFLEARRSAAKRPCASGHMYCLRCREPRRPAGNMVDYLPNSGGALGNLRAICSTCGTFMHRRIARAKLREICSEWEIAFPQAAARLGECHATSVHCDSGREPEHEANSQPR